jgi:hypothetical protein
MKKLLFVLMVLAIATPAMAAEIRATDEGSGVVRIDYIRAAGDAQRVRAFGIDLSITSGNAVYSSISNFKTDGESTAASKGYGIYPGTIVIDSTGAMTSPGSPKAPDGSTGENPSGITLELGSLFVGEANAPVGASGTVTLCKVTYTGTTTSHLTLTLNSARGGVVNEDGTVTSPLTLTGTDIVFAAPEAVKNTAPFYNDWKSWGSPPCWAFQRQCRGDINGIKNVFWVQGLDLTIFRAAFNKTDLVLSTVVVNGSAGICADLNHTKNVFRVQGLDLTEFRKYFNKADASVPVCDGTNYNFWTN